jgi:cytochrome c556
MWVQDNNMRITTVVLALVLVASVAASQTAKPAAPAPQTAKPAAPAGQGAAPRAGVQVTGDLAQVMRGILFPNSNLIFDAQQNDPGAPPKKTAEAGGGASATFANIYTGWQVVENAAIAIAESADLILKPGRVCSNGKPAPVGRADYQKFAAGLRQAGREALKAAQTKKQDAVIEVTDKVAEACANCHEVYRDKGPAGSPARCTP